MDHLNKKTQKIVEIIDLPFVVHSNYSEFRKGGHIELEPILRKIKVIHAKERIELKLTSQKTYLIRDEGDLIVAHTYMEDDYSVGVTCDQLGKSLCSIIKERNK